MFDRISTFLTDTLIEGGTLKSEERSLYIYCFGTMLETAANLLSAIIIGALLGEFPAALIFMLVFIPLRSMAGGFHCNSAGGCYLMSTAVFLTVILTYGRLSFSAVQCVLICAAEAAAVGFLAPAASPNKPMSDTQKVRNRRISLALAAVFSAAVFVLLMLDSLYAYAVLESMSMAVVSMVIGRIKYRSAA